MGNLFSPCPCKRVCWKTGFELLCFFVSADLCRYASLTTRAFEKLEEQKLIFMPLYYAGEIFRHWIYSAVRLRRDTLMHSACTSSYNSISDGIFHSRWMRFPFFYLFSQFFVGGADNSDIRFSSWSVHNKIWKKLTGLFGFFGYLRKAGQFESWCIIRPYSLSEPWLLWFAWFLDLLLWNRL